MESILKLVCSTVLSNTIKRKTPINTINKSLCTIIQQPTDTEKKIYNILKVAFPSSKISVEDVSGGCGAMYDVRIVSSQFKSLSLVRQHKLVTDALGSEIRDMHGIRILTEAPSEVKD